MASLFHPSPAQSNISIAFKKGERNEHKQIDYRSRPKRKTIISKDCRDYRRDFHHCDCLAHPGLVVRTCPHWCGLPHSVLCTYESGGRRSAAHAHRVLRMCWHSRRDVSGLEEVECGPGPGICRLQDY